VTCSFRTRNSRRLCSYFTGSQREAEWGISDATKLNRALDLIIHGPAHRGANGAAMPTDEDDPDGHFFFNHPERGGYSAA